MSSQAIKFTYSPFFLLTPRLIILPTPSAIHVRAYRDLYAHLHSLHEFCAMGFGDTFLARDWDEEQRYSQIKREVIRSWDAIGLGDTAVGLIPEKEMDDSDLPSMGRKITSLHNNTLELRIIEGVNYENIVGDGKMLENIEWVGYAGVRDAKYGIPEPEDGELPLPHWKELIEIRYGVSPAYWGKGIATEAARSVMSWAIAECSVQRFIAETQKENSRSGAILKKLGFVESGTNYWKEPSYIEWEKRVS